MDICDICSVLALHVIIQLLLVELAGTPRKKITYICHKIDPHILFLQWGLHETLEDGVIEASSNAEADGDLLCAVEESS
jgi:hypothetical protein